MSNYKIKLEDKAAFINRLDKQGIEVNSYEIIDNKSGRYFEFITKDPVTDSIVDTILKQSTKINKLKEMSKLTKSQLTTIIREELSKMKDDKKKLAKKKKPQLKEYSADSQAILDLGYAVKDMSKAVYDALGGEPEEVGNNILALIPVAVGVIGGALGKVISKVKGMMDSGEIEVKDQSITEQPSNQYSYPSNWPSHWPPPCSSGKCDKKYHSYCMDYTPVGWIERRCSHAEHQPKPKPKSTTISNK